MRVAGLVLLLFVCLALATKSHALISAPARAQVEGAREKPGARRHPETPPRRDRRQQVKELALTSGVQSSVDHYVSKMDGERRPYGVAWTDESTNSKPLIVIVNPGAFSHPENEADLSFPAEEMALQAKTEGENCIVIRPSGRGPGSLYQNYGEVDVIEAIADAVSKHPVDSDRISLFGHSMGGAATWYLLTHYPDLFSAGAALAGYCDYRLWSKPGGFTFSMPPWEESSWKSRSAAFLWENLEHTPVWILHGEWDRGVGSGVSVEHSRSMAQRLGKAGFSFRYSETPKRGHQFTTPELSQQIASWLLKQKKIRKPPRVRFATYGLRHNRSYWVSVDQLKTYGLRGSVDAHKQERGVLATTSNVRTLSLGPISDQSNRVLPVFVDGQDLGAFDLSSPVRFQCSERGLWKRSDSDLTGEKRSGNSGPISDVFFDDVILVQGTVGTESQTYFNEIMVHHTRNMFRNSNGGLHRGGILGQNSVDLLFAKDVELSEEEIRDHNLLLFGNSDSNALLRRFGSLPVRFGEDAVTINGRVFRGKDVSIFAVFPHPCNPSRYVAVHGGVTADAMVHGSHLNLLLLPDYLIYDGDRMLEWGFWDNRWQFPQ
jgi:pimeloyl-ACP methyl ester carboxylesterase